MLIKHHGVKIGWDDLSQEPGYGSCAVSRAASVI